jgi:hypothetical protein
MSKISVELSSEEFGQLCDGLAALVDYGLHQPDNDHYGKLHERLEKFWDQAIEAEQNSPVSQMMTEIAERLSFCANFPPPSWSSAGIWQCEYCLMFFLVNPDLPNYLFLSRLVPLGEDSLWRNPRECENCKHIDDVQED